MYTNETIYRERLNDVQRITYPEKLFGVHFPMRLEPTVFNMARRLSEDYTGGLWSFYILSNGGFYMAPELPETFNVTSDNGYQCTMTADALGIGACLYAYSHLSFAELGEFSEVCADQYHLLRSYMLEHTEAKHILGIID